MCVAIPGKVISVEERMAKVDFNGNIVNAMSGLVNVKAGDYVLVHAGCIIQVMTKKDAMEIIEMMEDFK